MTHFTADFMRPMSLLAARWCVLLLAGLLACPVWAQQGAKTVRAKPAPRVVDKKPVETPAAADSTPLTPAQLGVATLVHVGKLPCELGQTVEVQPIAGQEGRFHLVLAKQRFTLTPEPTTTGAVRLEDKVAGVVWLQLINKSMLMNHKLGRRMADECKSPAQELVAQEMQRNPPPSLLDAPKPGAAAVAANAPAAPAIPATPVTVNPVPAPRSLDPIPLPAASAPAATASAPAPAASTPAPAAADPGLAATPNTVPKE